MKATTLLRITSDRWKKIGWKEHAWAAQRTTGRILRLARRENRRIAAVIARDQLRFLAGRARPVHGQTGERADAAAGWLLLAHEATPDAGVSFGYFPLDPDDAGKWRRSYPETTGYIMSSLLDYAERRNRPDIARCCHAMARWEAAVQMPSGAVQGGTVCPPERQTPAVFNTGMVLFGYTAVLRHGADGTIRSAAGRAAEFLVGDQGSDGHFRTHGAFVTADRIKTYNCLCGWSLVRVAEETGDDRYRASGVRAVEAAVSQQRANGWFANNCLDRPEAPLLHTIGYTLQGILEVGILARRNDLLEAVLRGIRPILARMDRTGFLHGRFYENWEPATFSSCLTGSAQTAVVCYRLHEITGEKEYLRAADRIVDFLKAHQVLASPEQALNGALPGSFPILGEYMTAGYPNWATKYFLDALLLQERLSGSG